VPDPVQRSPEGGTRAVAGRLARPARGDALRGAVVLLAGMLGLLVADAVLGGLRIDGVVALLTATVAVSLVGWFLRPGLVAVATLLGWPGAVLLALFGQAVIVFAALSLVPGVSLQSFWSTFWASWIVAAVSTLTGWVLSAGTDGAVVSHLVRRARRSPSRVPDPEVTGVVFVQLDGVPFPVLQWGVFAGTLPTLSRWVRSGGHRMVEWTPMLPATTPASQMGILHGTIEGIPAFRWLDRATGRVFVANRPKDAADIEAAHSDGRGLLADDGVSVSNLFTGDAPAAFATMSAVGSAARSPEGRRAFNRYFSRPDGLARGLTRTVSEVVRERFQASRQVRQDMRPRVRRGWGFAAERSALNGVLRDFNTITVAEAMFRGVRSVYVDYVDYDAVAHHAGISRPESLDALVGLDRVLAQLEEVAELAPRPYRFVVLSDHGQSQGEVFADRYGEDLATLVGRLSGAGVAASTVNTEGSGRLEALAVQGDAGPVVARAVLAGGEQREEAHRQADSVQAAASRETGEADAPLLVFGSGNLGLVFVAGAPSRVGLAELERRFPALVRGLVAHPGVGFVVVDTDEGPVVLGAGGQHRLRDGAVTGDDPLAPFGPDAPAFVRRAAAMPEFPDLAVNSLLDPDTGEVAAFEGLVGCHGGLGGWQDRAMLVWPADLPAPTGRIVGADAVHLQLVAWLEHLGHRRDLPPAPTGVRVRGGT
jgi:uncharacterized membrane protein YvlD (DUF360 family)